MAGYGRFIGRVGGLAVALGIGVAVAEGCPVAMASGGNDGTGSHTPDKPGGQEHSTPAHRIGTAAGRQRHAAATPDDPSPGTGHTTATTGGTDSERTETTDTNTAQETNRGPGDTTPRVRKHLGLDAPQHVLSRLTRTRGLTEPKPITDESTREPQTVVDPQPDPAAATFAAVEVAPQSQHRSAFRLPSTAPDVLAAAPLHRLQNLAASRLDPTAHSEERSSALPDLTAFTVNESAVNEIDAGLNSTPIGITPAPSFASYSAPATTSSSLTTPTTPVSSNPIERVLSLVGLGSLFNNNSNGVAPDNPLLNGVLEWVRRTFDNGSPTDTPQSVNLSLNQGQAATPFTLTGATDRDGDTVTYQPGTYTSSSSNATLVVDTSGNATYTPATSWNGTAPASDTFAVTTTDENSGWHVHGIGGLLNAVTFGLAGDPGHTGTHQVTVNTTPAVLHPEVSAANHADGSVTGTIDWTPPSGGTPSYSNPNTNPDPTAPNTWTTSGGGTVTVDPSTGSFTYTPDVSDRLNAYTHPGQNTDTFTVTATDDQGVAHTLTVAVPIDPTPAAITHSATSQIPASAVNNDSKTTQGPDGSLIITTPGGTASNPSTTTVVTHPDGTTDVYVATATQTGLGTDLDPYKTTVTVVRNGGAAQVSEPILGAPEGGPVIGANGTVAQSTTNTTITDLGSTPGHSVVQVTITRYVTVLSPDGDITTSDGIASGSPVTPQVGADGTVAYVARTGLGSTESPYQAVLTVLHPNHTPATTESIEGSVRGLVVGDNGTVALTTTTSTVPNTAVATTTVVRPDGSLDHIGPLNTTLFDTAQVGPHGTVSLVTRDPDTGTTTLTTLSPEGVTHVSDPIPGTAVHEPRIGADGTPIAPAEDGNTIKFVGLRPDGTTTISELSGTVVAAYAPVSGGTIAYLVQSDDGDFVLHVLRADGTDETGPTVVAEGATVLIHDENTVTLLVMDPNDDGSYTATPYTITVAAQPQQETDLTVL